MYLFIIKYYYRMYNVQEYSVLYNDAVRLVLHEYMYFHSHVENTSTSALFHCDIWSHKASLVFPLFIEVAVPSQ